MGRMELRETVRDIRAVRALARRLDPEPEHCFQVCRYALQLFDGLMALHGLGPRERDVLEAAALLHDTGHVREMRRHHKHSLDIILEQQLPGFTPGEHRMVACVARYHRKAFPSPSHRVYADLPETARAAVTRLAAMLRVADGLDRGHMATARGIAARVGTGRVCLTVTQRRPCGIDIDGALRKAALFESCFGRRLEIRGVTLNEEEDRDEPL